MKLIKKLLEKFKSQFKYLISGVVAAIVEFSVFNLIVLSGNGDMVLIFSQIISYALGLLTAFFLHTFWTFKGEKNHSTKKQFIMYTTVALINLFVSTVILTLLVNQLSILAWLAKLIVMSMVVFWNFFILQKIVFAKKK